MECMRDTQHLIGMPGDVFYGALSFLSAGASVLGRTPKSSSSPSPASCEGPVGAGDPPQDAPAPASAGPVANPEADWSTRGQI